MVEDEKRKNWIKRGTGGEQEGPRTLDRPEWENAVTFHTL